MVNITDSFPAKAKKEIQKRGLSVVRVALDLGENPVQLHQILGGHRRGLRIREKLSRYLGIPLEA